MPDIFIDKDTPEPQKEQNEKHVAHPAEHEAPKLHRVAHPDADAIESVNKILHGEKHTAGLLSSYCVRPEGIGFANQEPDEMIILFVRRHFITNVPWILTTLLLYILPPVLFSLMQVLNLSFGTFPIGLLIVLTGFYYLVVTSYAFSKFVSWFYNIGIITQKRLVDLDTTNILSHNTAAASFKELVDIKFIQRGFLQSFFDYGNVDIQTEAIRANFEFDAAPKPTKIVDIISDLRIATKGGVRA